MANEIITTTNLKIGYKHSSREQVICSDISISVEPSKVTSLIGINGAGKSTLLRTLAGLQPALSGSIFIDGQNSADLNRLEVSKKLSLVLTEKLPESNLSVFELVATARQPYTNWIGTLTITDRDLVNNALRLTNIANLSNKKVHHLSDGQLQRVMIARALAQDTPVIILDEPTTHLDLENKISIFRLIRELAVKFNKCVLFSTHDIELAIQLSDSMIVMTTVDVVQDSPANLIKRGVFDKIFSNSDIGFDAEKVKFIFKDI